MALSYMQGGTAGPWAQYQMERIEKVEIFLAAHALDSTPSTAAEGTDVILTWTQFAKEFSSSFKDIMPKETAQHWIRTCRQKQGHTMVEFTSFFKEHSLPSEYGEEALITFYKQALPKPLWTKINELDTPVTTLVQWYKKAIVLNMRWIQSKEEESILAGKASTPKQAWGQNQSCRSNGSTFAPRRDPNTMDVDGMQARAAGFNGQIGQCRGHLTLEERASRQANNTCFYCGQVGHI